MRILAAEHKDKQGNTGYVCRCGRKHLYSAYAVAQMAMIHTVHHSCECGRTNVCYDFRTMIGKAPNGSAKCAS